MSAVEGLKNQIRSQVCCIEDYGAMGVDEVTMNGRAEMDRLVDALIAAVRAEERARCVWIVEALDRALADYGRLCTDDLQPEDRDEIVTVRMTTREALRLRAALTGGPHE